MQTKSMVLGLPESGSIVVVYSGVMREYVRRMIYDLRGQKVFEATKVLVVGTRGSESQLQGIIGPVFVDHAFYERVYDPMHRATVQRLVQRANGRKAG